MQASLAKKKRPHTYFTLHPKTLKPKTLNPEPIYPKPHFRLQVHKEFVAVLGAAHLPYLELIHQLIICEEQWAGQAHK